MKTVPGDYGPILGWRIHEKGTHDGLPNTEGTVDSGRVIHRLNPVLVVCEMVKMRWISTQGGQFRAAFGLDLAEESMKRVLARLCQVLEALGTEDGSYAGQIWSPLCAKYLKWRGFAPDEASSMGLVTYSWVGNPSRGY
jgi:hypothetical protein